MSKVPDKIFRDKPRKTERNLNIEIVNVDGERLGIMRTFRQGNFLSGIPLSIEMKMIPFKRILCPQFNSKHEMSKVFENCSKQLLRDNYFSESALHNSLTTFKILHLVNV